MDIGSCCICLTGFNVVHMGVLPCLHTFHYACIAEALRANGKCPLCRQRATVHQIVKPQNGGNDGSFLPNGLPKKAMSAALDYYDRSVSQHSADGSTSDAQREQLQICLNSLLSTLESDEEERQEKWERLKLFLKVCSLAAVSAVLAFLFTLYWPVLASLSGRVVRTVWSLITSLRDLLIGYWPELFFGGLLISTFVEPTAAASNGQQNSAGETANEADEEE